MFDYFTIQRRRERLEDRLGEAEDSLDTCKLFQRNHGGWQSRIRAAKRRITKAEYALGRFNKKHPEEAENE